MKQAGDAPLGGTTRDAAADAPCRADEASQGVSASSGASEREKSANASVGEEERVALTSPAPAPPAPSGHGKDYRDLAEDVARIHAQQAERARAAKRTRAVALCIAIAGVLLVAVGAYGALLLTHLPEASEGDATVESDSTQSVQDDSGNDSSDEQSSSASGVSAVEEVVASDQIRAAFSSLAANDDGRFTDFVQAFMDLYDDGVDGETSYTLSDLGIQADELAEALLSGFSCSVSSMEIQGSTAWVNVEVTSKSLADQADAFARTVDAEVSSFEDEESYKEFLRQASFDSFDGVSPRSHTLLITVDRSSDGWPVTDATMEYILGSVWYTSA